jgi:hypothetical protein
VIVLGYVDGPTHGILECGTTGATYKFDILERDDVRFYSLAPLPQDSVADFVRLLGPYQQPRWPVWCPLWSFPSESVRKELEHETDRVLARAGPVEWIVAAEELSQDILAARRLTADDLRSVTDWHAFLGLGCENAR